MENVIKQRIQEIFFSPLSPTETKHILTKLKTKL